MTTSSGGISWAFGVLAADPTIAGLVGHSIFDSLASQGTKPPYIIIQQQSSSEEGSALDGTLGATRLMLTIKAITDGSGYGSAEQINDAIQKALHQKSGTVPGIVVRECLIKAGIRYPEVQNGKRYNHLGTLFSLLVSQA